jgi:uncharacterized protein
MPTLILAISARKLAEIARRVGAEIVVADLFGDVDTRALAPWHPLPGSLETGVDGDALLAWVRGLDQRFDGIVYGSGFEREPALLGGLSAIAPLLGNPPEAVAAMKDPFGFAALMKRLGLPHPEIAKAPGSGAEWLRKRRGGSGGTHISPATAGTASVGPQYYFQARMAGEPVSALFVANGRTSRVLGFSLQWTAPTPARPFRYGGCAGPVSLVPRLTRGINRACNAITAAAGLVGLNSLDLLVTGETYTILEVNPRPGATLDLFDDLDGRSLWDCHLRGVCGDPLPEATKTQATRARAATVVYADLSRDIPVGFDWGDGIADIPEPGSHIATSMPICTVKATGPDLATARTAVEQRAAALLARLPLSLRESA